MFDIVKNTEKTIYIRDTGIGKSITHDAENVCEALVDKFGDKRIIYRDTNGSWDELIHKSGKFIMFKILNLTDANIYGNMETIE